MRKRYNNADFLYECYVNHKMSVREIAKSCDVSHMTIFRALKRLNIETRSQEVGYSNWQDKKNGPLLSVSTSSSWTAEDEAGLEYILELLGFDY